MFKNINLKVYKFVILGALTGALIGLVASYFMDFVVTSYSTNVFLSYEDWMFVCIPSFASIGTLVNLVLGLIIYEDPEEKSIKKIFRIKK